MDTLDQARKLEKQASDQRNQGKTAESIKNYQQAKKLFIEAGSLDGSAGMQHMIGVCHKINNDIDAAMPAYEQAITDYKKAGNDLGPGRVERDIATTYENLDRLDEAETHLLRAKASLESAPHGEPNPSVNEAVTRDAELGVTLVKLGQLYTRQNKLDNAEKQILDGLALIRSAGHPFYEITALMHLGALYFATKHYGRMLANVEAALGLIYEHGFYESQSRRLAQIYGLMSHGYLHSGHQASAKHFAKKSLDIINSLDTAAQESVKKDISADELQKLL